MKDKKIKNGLFKITSINNGICDIDTFDNLVIDANGFRPKKNPKYTAPLNEEEIDKAMNFVQHLEKKKIKELSTCSYGLKHRVEDYYKSIDDYQYCSNGALIIAMIKNGFDVWYSDGPNGCFNFTKSSYKKIMNEIEDRIHQRYINS